MSIFAVHHVDGSTTRGKKRLSHIILFVAIPTTIALFLLLIFLSRSIHMRKRKALEAYKGTFTFILKPISYEFFFPLRTIYMDSSDTT